MSKDTQPADLFEVLSTRLDVLTESLQPEKVGMARGDYLVKAGMAAQREVQHRRGLLAQDRATRLQRDAGRDHAVRDIVLQGKTQDEAEALVASYMGPRSPLAVPDPKTVQPTAAEENALRVAAERLEAILADDFVVESDPNAGQMGPAPAIKVTPGRAFAAVAEA